MRAWLSPVTRKRLHRFRNMKRAWVSFWLLALLYGASLLSPIIANEVPLYVRFDGRSHWPVFQFYPDDRFTGSGRQTRPDYKALAESDTFAPGTGNRMVFPPVPFGPNEIIPPGSIRLPDEVSLRIRPRPPTGNVNINPDGIIVRSVNAAGLLEAADESALRRQPLDRFLDLPPAIRDGVEGRFRNEDLPGVSANAAGLELRLNPYPPRSRPPRSVRITLRRPVDGTAGIETEVPIGRDGALADPDPPPWWTPDLAERLLPPARRRFDEPVPPITVEIKGIEHEVAFDREQVTYPFRPVPEHRLGLDSSGRDVFVQILYGMRVSMSFGLVLVVVTMAFGIVIGAIQGYFGGTIDIVGQRLIEVWSALPFLYIMILLGSIYGRSFGLLLFCYGIFNWIGISYYIRAEFLKLRKQPFVEAAQVMGLTDRRIIFRHILPNALVPVITFFPFSLVGAIGSLAALDYLGFGLPPPTPSWGALLSMGQEFRFAWWLILYPSLALFVVILLGVFVGEGVRAAFDPRHDQRLE